MNQCRWAPSLGELEGTHQEAWGTVEYTNRDEPCVFFGLYDVRDYVALWRHRGKAWVLWAGSDILNLRNNFYFNNGKLRLLSKVFSHTPRFLVGWLARKAEHWVENEGEALMLHSVGIPVTGICPSYMGEIEMPMTYRPGNSVYLSCSGERTAEYGFGIIDQLAPMLPDVQFHLYGSEKFVPRSLNVVNHGRVTKEKMNEETEGMQIGLRMNGFDGFSEILAKSVLRGQHAISRMRHPMMASFRNPMELVKLIPKLLKEKANIKARDYYRQHLNEYPWAK